jgi:hypothetical protein
MPTAPTNRSGYLMGDLVQAHCACGYSNSDLAFGAGMLDFTTACCVPAACDRCREVVVVNYLAKRRRCPHCRGPVTCYVTLETTETQWTWRLPTDQLVALSENPNDCPACGARSLSFSIAGSFD